MRQMSIWFPMAGYNWYGPGGSERYDKPVDHSVSMAYEYDTEIQIIVSSSFIMFAGVIGLVSFVVSKKVCPLC